MVFSRSRRPWPRHSGQRSFTICTARLACLNACALFRARAVAGFAVFLARQLDLGGDACGGFLEGERHVVAQVGATLCAAASTATAAPSKQILEAEEIPKNVVEILENSAVKTLTSACAGKARMTVGVVNLALLRIAQNAVGFGTFAKLNLRLGLIFGVAVRMPLQRRLAVGGLDFVNGGGSRNA